jgi:hypothetical protein
MISSPTTNYTGTRTAPRVHALFSLVLFHARAEAPHTHTHTHTHACTTDPHQFVDKRARVQQTVTTHCRTAQSLPSHRPFAAYALPVYWLFTHKPPKHRYRFEGVDQFSRWSASALQWVLDELFVGLAPTAGGVGTVSDGAELS